MNTKSQFYVEVDATTAEGPRDLNSPEGALTRTGQAQVYSGTSMTARALARLQVDLAPMFDQLQMCIDLAAERLRPRPGGPAETSIEFGVKIAADGSVMIAKVGSEVHLKVSAKWDRSASGSNG